MALLERVEGREPGGIVVVVRTKDEATRLRRRLSPGVAVLTLARFLAQAGPAVIDSEDLVPDRLLRWLVDAGVSPGYDGVAREHMVSTLLDAVVALERNGVRPPYPGAPTRDVEASLEAAHARLLAGLETLAARGRHARFMQEASATDDSGLAARWPRLEEICFFGIDSLSPVERSAVTNVTSNVRSLAWFVLGRPPGEESHPGLALSDPLVAWLAARSEPTVLAAEDLRVRARALAHLFSDAPMRREGLAGVAVLRPTDAAAEVRASLACVRDLLREGVQPERIGIIVPRLERYAATLVDAFAAHEIAAAVSYHGSLRASAVGSFLAALLSAFESGLERDAVLDVLAHPLARFEAGAESQETAEPPAATGKIWMKADFVEAMLHEHGLHPRGLEGPTGWHAAMERIRRTRERDGRALKAWERGQVAGMEAFLARLDRVTANKEGEAFLGHVRAFLDESGLARGVHRGARHATDAAAVAAAYRGVLMLLDEAEDALRAVPPPGDAQAAVREFLGRGLAETEVPIPADPDEGVQVVAWRNARNRAFEHVIVLGATQDAIPLPGAREAVDALLAPRFPDLEHLDEVLESRRILHGLLMDTPGSVSLLAPRREQDEPIVLSVLAAELAESFRLDDAPVPDEAPWTRLDAARLAGISGRPLAAPPAQAAAASRLVAARADAGIGPYTGGVDPDVLAAAPALRPLSRGPAYSTSGMTQFATCAFKAYALRGLRLRARMMRGPDVDGLEKGDLLHRIVERFLREGLARERPYRLRAGERAAAEERFYGLAVAEIEWRHRGISWDALGETLLGGLDVRGNPHRGAPRGLLARFLDAMTDFAPDEGVVGVEVPFGDGETKEEAGGDGTGGPEVLFDTPAGRISLRGKVDRLDRVRATQGYGVRVVDLKTGDLPHRRLVEGGVDFQLPFYVLAARVLMPGEPVVEGAYHQLKRARSSEVGYPRSGRFLLQGAVGDEEDLFARTPERVAEILAAEANGRFPLTLLSEPEANCARCELRRACGLRPELFAVRRDAALRARAARSTEYGYVADRVLEAAGAGVEDEE